MYQHNCRSEKRIAKRLESIKKAVALTDDRAMITGLSLGVTTPGQGDPAIAVIHP